jgi:hypothetical protein
VQYRSFVHSVQLRHSMAFVTSHTHLASPSRVLFAHVLGVFVLIGSSTPLRCSRSLQESIAIGEQQALPTSTSLHNSGNFEQSTQGGMSTNLVDSATSAKETPDFASSQSCNATCLFCLSSLVMNSRRFLRSTPQLGKE